MHARLVAAACLALVVGGCGAIDQMLGRQDAGPTRFEVWNQTLDPVFLLDPAGRILSLDACGHATTDELDVTSVDVRMDAGSIFTMHIGGDLIPPFLVITATGEPHLTIDRPAALPPCQGHLQVPPDK